MSEDAIEVTVENQSQVLAFHLFHLQMVQRGKRNDFVLCQSHGYVVHLNSKRTVLHPQELIQSLVPLQPLVFMKTGGHRDIAVQARI